MRPRFVTGSVRVAVALGSNQGNREAHLKKGVESLAAAVDVEAVSSVYLSAPVGFSQQRDFLNAVVVGRTTERPRPLLALALQVEQEAGRERTFRDAPRTLDVDLILYGDQVLAEPGLRIPHPRYRGRAFVLAPLAEVAPGFVDPETRQTVMEIWKARRDTLPGVRTIAPPDALWTPGSGSA